jgi:hypothetical protein
MKAILITKNINHKAFDYRNILSKWNISLDVLSPEDLPAIIDNDVIEKIMGDGIRFVFRDSTYLVDNYGFDISEKNFEYNGRAHIATSMDVWVKTKKFGEKPVITMSSYKTKLDGFVVSQSEKYDSSIFGWDDRFIPVGFNHTLHNLRKSGFKMTGREIILDKILQQKLYKPKELAFSDSSDIDDIDLTVSGSVFNIVQNNEIFKKIPQDSLSYKLFLCAARNGPFLRRKTNPKNGNYWNPGLNGGIPLTPKRDATHELTYFYHDVMHHLMPDLIFDGNNSIAAKNTYMISRMLSEAFSLVLTDMIFIDELKRAGHEYDYSRRKIYPVYLLTKHMTLKEQLFVLSEWVIFGRLDLPQSDEVSSFVGKYENYFTADWRWTSINWDAVSENPEISKEWISMVGEETISKLSLLTVTSFMKCALINENDSKEEIFEKTFEYWFSSINSMLNIVNWNPTTPEYSVNIAIKKWSLGQTYAYAKIGRVKNVMSGFDKLLNIIKNDFAEESDGFRAKDIISTYLSALADFGLITKEQAENWSIVFPHFSPNFVSYNEDRANEISLVETINTLCK